MKRGQQRVQQLLTAVNIRSFVGLCLFELFFCPLGSCRSSALFVYNEVMKCVEGAMSCKPAGEDEEKECVCVCVFLLVDQMVDWRCAFVAGTVARQLTELRPWCHYSCQLTGLRSSALIQL